MNELPIHICVVDTPEGTKHYVTLFPHEVVFSKGLIGEAIVGELNGSVDQGMRIEPAMFVRNSEFVKFMHDVIARSAPTQEECRREARRVGNGWVYLVDRRTKSPAGAVPAQDIIGALQAKDGELVPGSYKPNQNHLTLSADGFFRLSDAMQAELIRELELRIANPTDNS